MAVHALHHVCTVLTSALGHHNLAKRASFVMWLVAHWCDWSCVMLGYMLCAKQDLNLGCQLHGVQHGAACERGADSARAMHSWGSPVI
jgi:hypothetical protein